MSKPLGQHFSIPEHVIVTTSYSFTSVHDSSDIYCELFKLATIEYHSDLYLDYIGVSLSTVDDSLDTVSFGTVRLTLEVPKNQDEGTQFNLVSVCNFYLHILTDYFVLFRHMILWRQLIGFIVVTKGKLNS